MRLHKWSVKFLGIIISRWGGRMGLRPPWHRLMFLRILSTLSPIFTHCTLHPSLTLGLVCCFQSEWGLSSQGKAQSRIGLTYIYHPFCPSFCMYRCIHTRSLDGYWGTFWFGMLIRKQSSGLKFIACATCYKWPSHLIIDILKLIFITYTDMRTCVLDRAISVLWEE